MSGSTAWPAAVVIETARLTLEPLRRGHAEELAPALDDPGLHAFIGGRPATVDELRATHARQLGGRSPDGAQGWLNWILRHRESSAVLGTVQATLKSSAGGASAELAWVTATAHQGQGYAREAAAGMIDWLRGQGVVVFIAHIHPEHEASARVARHLGLQPTVESVDGEIRWSNSRRDGRRGGA